MKRQIIFSFCLFNNGDYSSKRSSWEQRYLFEVRYLDGLITNLRFLSKSGSGTHSVIKTVVYLDNKLRDYYSKKHKASIDKLLDGCELVFRPNCYSDPIGFIAERFKILERKVKKGTIVVIRDCDQQLTIDDINIVNSLRRDREIDTICYRQPSMSFFCMGGGLATKISGILFPDPIKLLDKYMKTGPDAWGFDEYLIHQISSKFGKKHEILLNMRYGKWYYNEKLIFDLPRHYTKK